MGNGSRARRVELLAAALVLAAGSLAVAAGLRAAAVARREASARWTAAWEARVRAEMDAAAARLLAVVAARGREVPGAPAVVAGIAWRPAGPPRVDDEDLREARAAEFARGDATDAIAAYRRAAAGGEAATRVAAARESARILRAAGDAEAARRAVLAALPDAAAAGREGMLLRVEAVRCRAEADASGLAADLLRGAFDDVAPGERAAALAAAGATEAARPFEDAARISDAPAGEASLLDGGRIGWIVDGPAGEFAFAAVPVAAAAAALVPALASGMAIPVESGGLAAPAPLRGLRLGPSALAEARRADEAAAAGRAVAIPAIGVAALFALGAGLLLAHARATRREAERREAFLGAVTHELKTPVANILLHAETLEAHAAADPSVVPRFAPVVASEARRLERRIREVLGLLSGAAAPAAARERFSPLDEARGLATASAAAAAADARGIALVVEGAGGEATAPGGAALFRRALDPVIENALAHARSRVRVAVESRDGRVRVAVEDDGDGIPEGDRERVFEPFVRLAPPRAGTAAGTGLGLAVTRRCATEAGGTARAEGPPAAGGARIVIDWPGGDRGDHPPG